MPASTESNESTQGAGLVERTLSRLLMQPWQISAIENLSPRFRIIDFTRVAPAKKVWTPGSKIQIKLDGGFITRTYTSILRAENDDIMKIVAYVHGSSPASRWIQSATIGETRPIFGPRTSLDLTGIDYGCVLFGDETSVGLAAVLAQLRPFSDTRYIFEANDPDELSAVVGRLGIKEAVVVERQPQNQHWQDLVEALRCIHVETTTYLLTGSAQSIQHVGREMRQRGIAKRMIRSKVYWATGKIGLD